MDDHEGIMLSEISVMTSHNIRRVRQMLCDVTNMWNLKGKKKPSDTENRLVMARGKELGGIQCVEGEEMNLQLLSNTFSSNQFYFLD